MEGPDALDEVVGQLEGFEAPAGAWETEILPARLAGYEPTWLDDRCLAGHVAWTRLAPRNARPNGSERKAAPVRTTPIALLARQHAPLWAALCAKKAEPVQPSPRGQLVVDFLRQHGASFFDEIAAGTGLLRSQAEEALAELVALGLVSSDSFAGLRALLVPAVRRKPPSDALISLSGADPLNLAGILTPGPKLAALAGNRVLYRDGLPVALLAGGEVQFLETLEPASEWQARIVLLKSAMPMQLAHQVS